MGDNGYRRPEIGEAARGRRIEVSSGEMREIRREE